MFDKIKLLITSLPTRGPVLVTRGPWFHYSNDFQLSWRHSRYKGSLGEIWWVWSRCHRKKHTKSWLTNLRFKFFHSWAWSSFQKTWEKAETRWMTSDKFLTRGVLIVCKSHIPSAIDLKAIMTMGGISYCNQRQKRFGNFVQFMLEWNCMGMRNALGVIQ